MSALFALCALALATAPQQSGRFKPAGAMKVPRTGHTATLLKDGRVLVVGGRGIEGLAELSSVEIYEPKSNHWKAAAPLQIGRSGHTATLLDDGRVLIVGGTAHEKDRFVALKEVELYDPKSARWTAAAPMLEARNAHTATKLDDGRVVVAGGVREQKGTLATVEAYDPTASSWAALPPMLSARSGHRAVKLKDGTVLVVGGRAGATLQSTERLDATGPAWSPGPTLSDPRQHHGLVLLDDGRAMAIGGVAPQGLTNLCELWSPSAHGAPAWALAEHSLSQAHARFAATVLRGGDVLLTGGEPYAAVDTPVAQRFITAAQKWCVAGTMVTSRKGHTATLLPDGRVLVVGGSSAGITEASAEVWESADGRCEEPAGISLDP